MHTSASSANRWKKNIETIRFLLLDSLSAFSHPSILHLTLAIRSQYFYYYDDYHHTYSSIWSLSSVIQAANESSVQTRFCFAVREKERGESPFLTLSSILLLLSILLVLVSVLCVVCVCGGQILFPVNCGGRRRFFPSSFHAHSHMPLIFFSYFIAKKRKTRNIIIILHTYILILILSSFFSSSYVITHPFLLLDTFSFF